MRTVGRALMQTAVVLFTRDLRVHDNPALAAACANAERVVPLFVLDPALAGRSANRRPLPAPGARRPARDAPRQGRRPGRPRRRPGRARRSGWPGEVGAEGIALAADVSGYARRAGSAARAGVRAAPACRCGSSPASRWCSPGDVRPGGGRPLPGLLAVPPGLGGGEVA